LNPDLALVRSLRKVLESEAEGKGAARSAVEELRRSPNWSGGAKALLLGHPIKTALKPIVESRSEEASMLAALVIASPASSALLVGRNGGALAQTLERWVRAKENRALEEKVMRFRSLLTSGVLGAVTAMVASVGPLVGSLSFTGSAPPADPATLLAGAAAMAGIGSVVLGLFMSGRGFVVNLAVTLGVFAVVGALASPLAAVTPVALWGVK
jgi:hypothetical protein